MWGGPHSEGPGGDAGLTKKGQAGQHLFQGPETHLTMAVKEPESTGQLCLDRCSHTTSVGVPHRLGQNARLALQSAFWSSTPSEAANTAQHLSSSSCCVYVHMGAHMHAGGQRTSLWEESALSQFHVGSKLPGLAASTFIL